LRSSLVSFVMITIEIIPCLFICPLIQNSSTSLCENRKSNIETVAKPDECCHTGEYPEGHGCRYPECIKAAGFRVKPGMTKGIIYVLLQRSHIKYRGRFAKSAFRLNVYQFHDLPPLPCAFRLSRSLIHCSPPSPIYVQPLLPGPCRLLLVPISSLFPLHS
jgi:hypothetical protein